MAILEVTTRVPPMPSICIGSGLPMIHFSTVSRRGPGGGMTDLERKTALLVPPRMYAAGMPYCSIEELIIV